jgi:hypothetical protein
MTSPTPDPAAEVPRPRRRVAQATVPGEPAVPGAPHGTAGGKTSQRRERAAAWTPRPGTEAASPLLGAASGRGRAQDPAGASLKAHGSHPAGSMAIAAAMSEDRGDDSLEAHLRRLMKDLGLTGFHVEKSLDVEKNRKNVSVKGWPDWTIRGPRGVLFRELKSQRGRVTPEQREWLDALAANGMNVGVWRPASLLSGAIAAELAGISAWRTRRGTRCVCDAYGSCPQGCAMCAVCGGEVA